MSEFVIRPDVACAFEVMRRCDTYFEGPEADACREGARDAHLLSAQRHSYPNSVDQEAYLAGNFTTYQDCGQMHTVITVHRQVGASHHHHHHDANHSHDLPW